MRIPVCRHVVAMVRILAMRFQCLKLPNTCQIGQFRVDMAAAGTSTGLAWYTELSANLL